MRPPACSGCWRTLPRNGCRYGPCPSCTGHKARPLTERERKHRDKILRVAYPPKKSLDSKPSIH